MVARKRKPNRYEALMVDVFLSKFREGSTTLDFDRDELEPIAARLKINLPKNLGDVIYSFKYRASLPKEITSTAPDNFEWVIKNSGRGKYRFVLVPNSRILPDELMQKIKIPDSTPAIVSKHAKHDEQALLTKIRYNRLIDIFTGVACYSLQNHFRTTVPGIGQVETDEIYVGVDKSGKQFVFPVQAKGGKDELGVVQIEQDILLCKHKYPDLICRAIAAQFLSSDQIVIFEFTLDSSHHVVKVDEKHYLLSKDNEISDSEIRSYNLI